MFLLGGAIAFGQQPDTDPQQLKHRLQDLEVSPGQILVRRCDMHSAPRERVQVCRGSTRERLAFARLHFGDGAFG